MGEMGDGMAEIETYGKWVMGVGAIRYGTVVV